MVLIFTIFGSKTTEILNNSIVDDDTFSNSLLWITSNLKRASPVATYRRQKRCMQQQSLYNYLMNGDYSNIEHMQKQDGYF